MPQVDFYVVDGSGDGATLRVACRVVEKAWGQGLRVYVLARDDEQAGRMDDTLWTFRQDSFVPHERWTGTGQAGARVLVASTADAPATPQVLVNLGAPVPSWYEGCARIAEIVGGDAAARTQGRQRYRLYRDAGNELRTHEVQA